MLQNEHGDKQNPLQRHVHIIPAPESQESVLAYHSGGDKKIRGAKEIEVKIQQMTMGSAQVDEEKKESGIRYSKHINLPAAASSYLTTTADLAISVHLE